MGPLKNSTDPDEMQHITAPFHQGLHCLLNFTCDPLKCTMGSPTLIVSISYVSENPSEYKGLYLIKYPIE